MIIATVCLMLALGEPTVSFHCVCAHCVCCTMTIKFPLIFLSTAQVCCHSVSLCKCLHVPAQCPFHSDPCPLLHRMDSKSTQQWMGSQLNRTLSKVSPTYVFFFVRWQLSIGHIYKYMSSFVLLAKKMFSNPSIWIAYLLQGHEGDLKRIPNSLGDKLDEHP